LLSAWAAPEEPERLYVTIDVTDRSAPLLHRCGTLDHTRMRAVLARRGVAMTTVTIRIPSATHERARRLAKSEARPIAQVITDAIDHYEREQMIAGYWADVERAYADPVVAAEEQAEIEAWDAASLYDLARSLAAEGEDEE
jgi:predicted transcriptional regulator